MGKKKPCEHFAVGLVKGQAVICQLLFLKRYCVSWAGIFWVGLGVPPANEVEKILKEFKKFKYCPKCGQKLEFPNANL